MSNKSEAADVKSNNQEGSRNGMGANVNKLVALVKEKELHFHDQRSISNAVLGGISLRFSRLNEKQAGKVLDAIEARGYTELINRATGQTDITDAAQDTSPQPPSPNDSGPAHGDSVEEGTEIIYVDNEPFEVTPEKRKAYHFHDQEMKMGWLKFSLHLAITLESELFKVSGYNTQEEYAKYHLGETRQSMNRKARRGRRILSMFPDVTTLLHSGKYMKSLDNIAQISPSKFNELIKFDDDEFDLKQLAEGGEATLPSGDTISIDEIKTQTVREVGKKMKEERKKLQGRIANLEEDKRRAREERDHYKGKLESNKDKIDRAQSLEQKYGKQAAKMEETEHLLDKTAEGLKGIEDHFGQINIGNSDPDEMKERAMSLMRRMTMQLEAARNRFPWLDDMDAFSVFPAWKLDRNDDIATKN